MRKRNGHHIFLPGEGRRRPPPPPPGNGRRRPLKDRPAVPFNRFPLPKSDGEAKILKALKSIYRSEWIQNVSMEDGKLLRILAETIGAKNIVEIGTSNGCSTLWFCLALRMTGGKITSYEADPERAALARKNFLNAGTDRMVTFIEGDAHRELKKLRESIDLVFLDADREGNRDYLKKLLPLVRPGGLIVSHNMSAPPRGISPAPDPAYIKAITSNAGLETIFLNMHDSGIGITLKKNQ